jgi:hypothetical protein
MLLKMMDCQVQPSPEFKINKAIEARTSEWIKDLDNNPPTPRKITKTRSPFDTPDLSHLKPDECPF